MGGYVPIEYPKWVGGVLVNSAEEEQVLQAAQAASTTVPCASELDHSPSSAAIRMGRTRMRRLDGTRIIACSISAPQIEAMEAAGFIDPDNRDDASELARGVGRVLENAIRPAPNLVRLKV